VPSLTPVGPPRSPTFGEISRRPAKSPRTAACAANAWSLLSVIWIWKAVWAPYSLASNSRFRETETATGRDRFDYRASPEIRPSIWRCRDHSAGMSQRRATPIPRGSRPSIAALTRSGARNASEIVMLTFRALQPSRLAIACTFAIGSALSSSSQRRPRAIDATSVARVSDRIGRQSLGGAGPDNRISRRRVDSVLCQGTWGVFLPFSL
jgi:hypothetical protein